MPDHEHMTMRGNIQKSPEEIALEYLNGLTNALGKSIWEFGYYAGNFGEYDLDGVRRSMHPAL